MNEYEGRINRVIDHVARNLDRRLPLAELAKIASFSPFHFHRLFRAMTGETVHDFVQRLRLEKAAGLLRTRPHASITEVALECGFGSSASFARAFRVHFGCTASDWRSGGCEPHEDRKIRQTLDKVGKARDGAAGYGASTAADDGSPRSESMNVEIKQMPAFHVAYVRTFGPYGEGVKEAWDRLGRWAGPRGYLGPESVMLGVAHDDPHVTPPAKCRYDACVPVPADVKPEREIGIADVPATTAAVMRFDGPREALPQAYDDLYGRWLPKSGYQPADAPVYELYRGNPEVSPGRLVFDICLPVRPL